MSNHDCPGVAVCFDHPRWYVWWSGESWRAAAPHLLEGRPFLTFAEAVAYATSRARAEALAAVQSAEGVTAR